MAINYVKLVQKKKGFMVPLNKFAKSRTMRACVVYVPTCLRASAVYIPTCLRAKSVPSSDFAVPKCQKRANVP